jgi:hypothetical protein
MSQFLIGQRVILTGAGGVQEIGIVVAPERDDPYPFDVWVYSPTKGYASCYAEHNVKPLPNGQF